MFTKKQPDVETVIGGGSTIVGELRSTGTVRVDGVLEGGASVDWVIVGEGGLIRGNVICRGSVVGGGWKGTSALTTWWRSGPGGSLPGMSMHSGLPCPKGLSSRADRTCAI